jgi:hypothetical protein
MSDFETKSLKEKLVRSQEIWRQLSDSHYSTLILKIIDDAIDKEVIRWNDDGNYLFIKDQENFTRDILPTWEKGLSFSKFLRQLESAGFHRIVHNEPQIKYAFAHPELNAGDQLIFQASSIGMKRKRVKKAVR